MKIRFLKPGLLTTVQDGGRVGYRSLGVSPCGVMDQRSYALACILAGCPIGSPVLETTAMGPEIEFEGNMYIAITGADMAPAINGKPVEMYRTLAVRHGDILSFGGLRKGLRGYIAFSKPMKNDGDMTEIEPAQGEFHEPVKVKHVSMIMGSCSTDMRLRIGGLGGNAIAAGDEIEFTEGPATNPAFDFIERRIDTDKWSILKPDYEGDVMKVRVVLGPQDDEFSQKGIDTFFSEVYTVTPASDRMGIRLDGKAIEHINEDSENRGNIISDGISFGAIQVPASGQPIVMMADRQTIGGYAKIGNVILVDTPLMAQAMPGTKIRFIKVSQEEAQRLIRNQRGFMRNLEGITERQRDGCGLERRLFSMGIDGRDNEVEIQKIR